MNNYEHEIECPPNRGIMNYLWYDYLHDSTISNIVFDHNREWVTFTLECCYDIDQKWDKLKWNREERNSYIDQHKDEFIYILSFKGVRYFHDERLIMYNDYLNGRFKNSAILCKLKAETKKPLYHFRMKIDDGYIDIIFSDFQVKKRLGRVKYPVHQIFYHSESASLIDKQTALTGDDYDRFNSMQKLYQANDESILEIVRENLYLRDDFEDSCLYSAYLLGKLGDKSDLNNLFELYLNIESYLIKNSICRCSTLLPKRNILDAIELIKFKNE